MCEIRCKRPALLVCAAQHGRCCMQPISGRALQGAILRAASRCFPELPGRRPGLPLSIRNCPLAVPQGGAQNGQHSCLQVSAAVPIAGTSRSTALPKPSSSVGFAEDGLLRSQCGGSPTGEALAGGIVLTPVSAPRYAAPLQPSASAESKSRGEQLAAQMRAPPAPARAWGRTPTPFPASPCGDDSDAGPSPDQS